MSELSNPAEGVTRISYIEVNICYYIKTQIFYTLLIIAVHCKITNLYSLVKKLSVTPFSADEVVNNFILMQNCCQQYKLMLI